MPFSVLLPVKEGGQATVPARVVQSAKMKVAESNIQLVEGVESKLIDDCARGLPTVVAVNCSREQFELFCTENEDTFRKISLINGNEIWVTQGKQTPVHSLASTFFAHLAVTYNSTHPEQPMLALRDCTVTISDSLTRAPDVAYWGSGRQNALIKSPNVHIEVGYTESLSHVIAWMDKIMADDPVATPAAGGQAASTQVMAYLAVKISYPLDIINPQSFRAIAVLFLYNAKGNSRRPAGIWSFGTLPATDATRNWLCTLLNSGPGNANTLNPTTHAALFHGDWINGVDPPCTVAHAEQPAYTVTLPGDAMVSINRHTLPVDVDTALYDCHISLFALQQAIVQGFNAMRLEAQYPVNAVAAANAGGGPTSLLLHQIAAHPADHLLA